MAKLKDELADMSDYVGQQRDLLKLALANEDMPGEVRAVVDDVTVALGLIVNESMPRYLDFLDFLEQDTVLQIQRLANERDQYKRELEELKKIPDGAAELAAVRKECRLRAVVNQNLQNENNRLIDRLTLVKDEFQRFKAAVSKQVAKARTVKARTKGTRKVKRK